jgi:hypothetical protein
MATKMTMKGFTDHYRDETNFKRPLGRVWEVKTFATFVTKMSTEHGGMINLQTTPRTFSRVVGLYEAFWLDHMNVLLRKDTGIRNGMLAALGVAVAGAAPAANLGAGLIFWQADPHGGNQLPAMQVRFNAMEQAEQDRCDWLQTTFNKFLLYFMEKIIGSRLMTSLRDAYIIAVDAGNDFKWRDAVSFLKSKLSGADSLYLSVGSITILRDDNTTLLEWILFHKSLVKQCVEKRIMNPNELWVRLRLGQVSPGERAKITMPMPQTETEREAFDLAALEVEIKASKKTFPTFK